MTQYPYALNVSRAVLRLLIVLNLALGAGITALLVASLAAEGPVLRALGVRPEADQSMLIVGMRLIMVVGIVSVPLAHLVLSRLLAMVDTVRSGDPFLRENAARLQAIAWALLGLELLHLVVGAIAAGVSTARNPLDINRSVSLTGWLAVLLLFVLARVFDHGARMREDLEGTI
jgi:hypothetical protein